MIGAGGGVCGTSLTIMRSETQSQLQPALLRLSAITSQFFIRFRAIALMIMSVGLNCGFEFEKGRQLLICFHVSLAIFRRILFADNRINARSAVQFKFFGSDSLRALRRTARIHG